MKRLREDNYTSFKRPFGTSRGESYGQTLNGGGVGGGQKLTTNDALHYLKEVKEMFQDQREKYDQFLEVMKDFKAQRIDTEGVIARVKELFKGHHNLIYGFNTFLPKGYEITLDEEDAPPKKIVEFEEAINFVNKIKKRFQSDDHVYKSFLDILNMYRKEHKNITEVYEEVSQLFEGHPDLLDEFTRFLPNSSASATVHHFQHGRNTFQRYDERSTAVPSSQQLPMDRRWRRDRINTSHAERDISVERPDLDDGQTMIKMHKEPKKWEKESRDRRSQDPDDREHEHDSNKDLNNQRLADKRKPTRKEGFPLASCDDKNALKRMYNQELIFCERVKEKLGSSDDYQAFLKCLHIYSTEIITRSELQSLVADLLGKYPDLMEGFNEFLEHCENLESLWNDGHLPRSMKTEDKDKALKRDIEGAKEKEKNKEKYWAKSIQELDLSNCQRCTPSYRLLPDDYPIPTASQRSEIGAKVLNDFWVSVTSGSEDYSFKHMRKNQYEESLFKCEDDRFELDMLLESASSTAKRVEDLLNSINDKTININPPICIEDHFSALNLRCIECLYGDHGLDVLDILRKNPALALPVILTRLKQKQEEWTKCRSDFNKVWAEIYAKNHYKSLDHRSFYFKQQDSKNLSTKSLVAEIKEIKENMQKEDGVVLAVAAGHEGPLVPHYEFVYSDADVHEDIHKLVKYSCEEICSTNEQFNKVMRLWSTFLEPFLGIPCPPHRTGGADACSRAQNYTARNTGAGAMEIGRGPGPESKQCNVSTSGNETVLDGAKSSGTNAASGNSTARVLGFFDAETTHRDNALTNAQPDRELNNIDSVDNVPEKLVSSNVSPLGAESSHGRANIEPAPGAQTLPGSSSEVMTDLDSTQLKEDAGVSYPALAASGNFQEGSGINQSLEESVERSKSEKEEGELSPNGDLEEDNSVVYGDTSMQVDPDAKSNGNGEDTELDNEADADDENCENGSEAGDDASGSDSAGDECSREDQEDEEDGERDELNGKAESECEAEIHCNGVDGAGLPVLECFFMGAKPLTKYALLVTQDDEKKDSSLFYGNDNFFVLFKIHQILYERILTTKIKSRSSKAMWNHSKDLSTSDPYASFMNALFNLLDGTSDNAKFEDDCRVIIGNEAYVLFTLDKVIYKLVKQLQTVATDEVGNKMLQLYEYEKSRKPGKFIESVYYENALVLLYDEDIFRFECASSQSRLSIRLMDCVNEKPDALAVFVDSNFSAYLHNEFLSAVPSKMEPCEVLLDRNKRKYTGMDESSAISLAMEDAQLYNGLEYKINCHTSKMFYVLDTEDFFFRPVRKRKKLPADLSSKINQARVQRFNKKTLPSAS